MTVEASLPPRAHSVHPGVFARLIPTRISSTVPDFDGQGTLQESL